MSDPTPLQKRVKRLRFIYSELVALAIFQMLFLHFLWLSGALIAIAIVGLLQCHWLLWKESRRRQNL